MEFAIGKFTIIWCVLSVVVMAMVGYQRYTPGRHLAVKKRLRRIWMVVAAIILATITAVVFCSEFEAMITQRAEEFRVLVAPWWTVEMSAVMIFVLILACLMLVALVAANVKKARIDEKRRKRSAQRTVRACNVVPSEEPMTTEITLDLPERVASVPDIK